MNPLYSYEQMYHHHHHQLEHPIYRPILTNYPETSSTTNYYNQQSSPIDDYNSRINGTTNQPKFYQPYINNAETNSEIMNMDSGKLIYPTQYSQYNGEIQQQHEQQSQSQEQQQQHQHQPHQMLPSMNSFHSYYFADEIKQEICYSPTQEQQQQQQQQQHDHEQQQQQEHQQLQQISYDRMLNNNAANLVTMNSIEQPSTTFKLEENYQQLADSPQSAIDEIHNETLQMKKTNVEKNKSHHCPDCNRWYSGFGHLKRHQNTALHKKSIERISSESTTFNSIENNNQNYSYQSQVLHGQQSLQLQQQIESNLNYSLPQFSSFDYSASSLKNQNSPIQISLAVAQPSTSAAASSSSTTSLHSPTISSSTETPRASSSSSSTSSSVTAASTKLGFLPSLGEDLIQVQQQKTTQRKPANNKIDSKSNVSTKISCNECGKDFSKPCYLTQHNKVFHSGVHPFRCQKCGKRFQYEVGLNFHLAKHNAVDKPFKCDLCPKQFHYRTDLRRHRDGHSGYKLHVCDVCNKGFCRKDHLSKHRLTHRNTKAFIV